MPSKNLQLAKLELLGGAISPKQTILNVAPPLYSPSPHIAHGDQAIAPGAPRRLEELGLINQTHGKALRIGVVWSGQLLGMSWLYDFEFESSM